MADGAHLLSWFWTPLVVVTAAAGERRSGQVAVSVHGASILPQHPRLTVGLWKTNFTHDLVRESGTFAVHLLRDDQEAVVYHFGLQSGRDVDKFATIAHTTGAGGAPLLNDCLGVFECRVAAALDAADHTIFLGDVLHSEARSEGNPLWWRDLRARMPADLLARWNERNAESMAASLRLLQGT
jgi:flavin reductase (DIM6/NTAB) family NADH-FMN oxidoreductase RutF